MNNCVINEQLLFRNNKLLTTIVDYVLNSLRIRERITYKIIIISSLLELTRTENVTSLPTAQGSFHWKTTSVLGAVTWAATVWINWGIRSNNDCKPATMEDMVAMAWIRTLQYYKISIVFIFSLLEDKS